MVRLIPISARGSLRFFSGLLAISILVQFFIAGMSALTNPDWWTYHLAWVSIFQWLVLPLPVLAWLSGPPSRIDVALSCAPTVQMALQYLFAHRALEGRLPIGMGLHAVNAAVMLVIVTMLATRSQRA